ncbi:MAG TPA: beta-propeller fold lactonase family protein [Chloroflexota bacterium]
MGRRQISRGLFLKGAAGAAGAALAAGRLGSALAEATPEGLASGRPIRGRLGASSSGKLTANDLPFAMASKPGAGPRHLAFHPGGSVVYVINELNSTIDVFGYDGERGALQLKQTVSTLPTGFEAMSTTAEVVVAPSGRFVYGSNRGHDSIAIFAADPASGMLSIVDWAPTGGQTPRNFNVDPTGSYLYAANQGSDNIWAFQIDQSTGLLSPISEIKSPTPVAIIFAV